jgi:hypothetical protein
MPKAILKFDLPEEQDEFKLATKGADFYSILWDHDQWMRDSIKYGKSEIKDKTPQEVIEIARKNLWELMSEKGIDLNMVV